MGKKKNMKMKNKWKMHSERRHFVLLCGSAARWRNPSLLSAIAGVTVSWAADGQGPRLAKLACRPCTSPCLQTSRPPSPLLPFPLPRGDRSVHGVNRRRALRHSSFHKRSALVEREFAQRDKHHHFPPPLQPHPASFHLLLGLLQPLFRRHLHLHLPLLLSSSFCSSACSSLLLAASAEAVDGVARRIWVREKALSEQLGQS